MTHILSKAAAAFLAFSSLASAADVKLNSYFADHMVLQRDKPLVVWGSAEPNAKVQVAIASQNTDATADGQGKWIAKLSPLAAGGPFVLRASSGSTSATANDVLIGDVWLCSGQSNMQMSLKESIGGLDEANLAGTHPKIRLCTVVKRASDKPESATDIAWKTNTPDTAANFSAVGYYFASELLKTDNYASVPIGLIDSSFGGTMAEGWTPKADLAQFDPKEIYDSMFGIKASGLYNAMIAPLGPTSLKGVIWYQGEGNSGHPENYARKLTTLIGAWRRQFADPNLPFIVVSLPDYVPKWGDHYWSWFREAQAKAIETTPNTAIALAINTTDGTDLHPKEKREIGRRAAFAARALAYKEVGVVGHGPVFKSAQAEGSSLRVNVDTATKGLTTSDGHPARGFMIAGEDGLYRFAQAKIDGDAIILTSDAVPAPKTVRYAWAGVPNSNIVNKDQLPLPPFRTDTFAPASIEVQEQSLTRHLETSAYDITIDRDGKVTSLRVHGKQILSTDSGTAGGTSVPGFFGPRSLNNLRLIGPDLIACSDNDVTVTFSFQEKSMTWKLANRGKDDLTFRIALGPDIKVSNGDTPTLSRGKVSLTLKGADKVSGAPAERVVEVQLKGKTERELLLTVTSE